MNLYFQAIIKEKQDLVEGIVPTLESYFLNRRDLGACRTSFDLIEYAHNIDLPDCVVDHPILKALNDGANDAVYIMNVGLISLRAYSFYLALL